MKKRVYFDKFDGPFWPEPSELEPYFLAAKGREWFFESRNDGALLQIEGLHGTDELRPETGRVDVHLAMTGHPELGVTLYYDYWDGRSQRKASFVSKGDLSRLHELVRDLHGTPSPVGLFIPFAAAWPAVKEFMETNGELPKSIAWVSDEDLPPGTFPDP